MYAKYDLINGLSHLVYELRMGIYNCIMAVA